jgi:predicted DNA-binding transcriptional regulator AlpA
MDAKVATLARQFEWTVLVRIRGVLSALSVINCFRFVAPDLRVSSVEQDDNLLVIVSLEAKTARELHVQVDEIFDRVLAELGQTWASVVEIQYVAASETDARLDKLPSCIGVSEAAEVLQVTKQRVGQLAKRDDFPEPVFTLRATPVWRESDIRKYALQRSQRTRSA